MLEREPLGSVKIGPKLLPSLGLALCPASVAHTGLLAPQSLGCLTVLPSPENVGNNQQKFVAQVRAPSTSPVARVAGGEGLAAVGSHTGWWSDPRLYPTTAPRKINPAKDRVQGRASSFPLSALSLTLQPGPPTLGALQSPPTGECSPLKLGTRTLPHL
jgi:hypothetical protein